MLGNQDLRRNLINKSIKINTTQNDVSKGYIVILMKSLSLHRLGVVPPSILATSSLTSLVMKLLRFAAEAKKLSNHHRTPIFWSVIQPRERNLTSLKRPSAHKFLKGYKLTSLKLIASLTKERYYCNFIKLQLCLGRITVSVIGADLSKSKMEGGISLKIRSND